MKLVKLEKKYEKQLGEMLEEWTAYNKEHPETNISPWAIFKNDWHDFDYYLNNLDITDPPKGFVPDSTFFLYDEERDVFVGACNIRHYLNDYLLKCGGHIGDGIRPSERRKGYASLMIKLAKEECRKLGIRRILMCCYKDNEGSRRSIINAGGIKENEIPDDGKITERYWIDNI